MSTYKKPCEKCGELVPPDANVCPFCGRQNPTGPQRCPKCRSPVEQGWKVCSNCGFALAYTCPKCGKPTFPANFCDSCGAKLTVVCPNKKCGFEQFPTGDTCIKCGKKLK